MQEWHEQDFRAMNEAEVEEDLEEVTNSLYATIAKGQDIMPTTAPIPRARRVCISTCLIMRQNIVLHQ